jgi:hypothetical protein
MSSHSMYLAVLVLLCVWIMPLGAQTESTLATGSGQPWVHIAFEEINSASPVIGEATLPLSLAMTVVDAVPQKTRDECKEEGFDLKDLRNRTRLLETGTSFSAAQEKYQLTITKIAPPVTSQALPSTLLIKTHLFPLKAPLTITNLTVKLLQLAFKDLKGMDEELTLLVEEIKKTPPTTLLTGEDKYLETSLEIGLE